MTDPIGAEGAVQTDEAAISNILTAPSAQEALTQDRTSSMGAKLWVTFSSLVLRYEAALVAVTVLVFRGGAREKDAYC